MLTLVAARVGVLIPAHNEGNVLLRVLRSRAVRARDVTTWLRDDSSRA